MREGSGAPKQSLESGTKKCATGRAAETKDARAYIRPLAVHQVPRLPRKSQGVDPTPCSAPSPTPAMQKQPAERRRPRDARAYIRPHAMHQVPRLPRKSHGRAAETKGRQGVHPTPCSAPSPTPATQKPPAERRRPRDARAYIRPLAVHQAPRLPSKSHRQSGGDQGTTGRTSDPLLCTKSHACYTKATGRAAETNPAKSHACHAKATGRAAENKGRQGVHPTPCSAPSPTPATQKPPAERRRREGGRESESESETETETECECECECECE